MKACPVCGSDEIVRRGRSEFYECEQCGDRGHESNLDDCIEQKEVFEYEEDEENDY